jgi:hypothetical protein
MCSQCQAYVLCSRSSTSIDSSGNGSSSRSSFATFAPFVFGEDLCGDEKRPSINSMPYSSRTPVSFSVNPVFLYQSQSLSYRAACLPSTNLPTRPISRKLFSRTLRLFAGDAMLGELSDSRRLKQTSLVPNPCVFRNALLDWLN